jgi:hypothetical protein
MDVRFRGKSGRAADITGMTEFDPKRPSVNWPALSMLRPFHVDGISRMQHLFLCLKEQEAGIQRRYQ